MISAPFGPQQQVLTGGPDLHFRARRTSMLGHLPPRFRRSEPEPRSVPGRFWGVPEVRNVALLRVRLLPQLLARL